ncbi:MAG: hypothetical protein A7316_10720 [Candidatus Altiarchaeales archaeon WOR_SM1_86-2]|nr:MAG: hypothetical protein A7316_10720 [Candidatus Altiarchaeales archaeon WOR_SM1_86-2]
MKANEKIFLHFLEGTDKQFVIPVYQRNYDWKKEHCEQLFNDLVDVCKNNFRSHFLGSIVSIYNFEGEGKEYLIIDGQQRITTLSLLLLAIYNLLNKNEIQTQGLNKEKIKNVYLINEWAEDAKKIRLKPVELDNEAFSKLFGDREDYILASNITKNYLYFEDRIKKLDIYIDDLFGAIERLIIVDIELKEGEDDPQLIFESLNSTGLSLTQADLVRNFILMKETSKKQREFYYNYWHKIEENTNKNKVSDFIRDYLTFKDRIIPRKDMVYLSFKRYVHKNYSHNETEELLKDLLKFSRYYKRIAFSKDNNPEINKLLERINKLEVTVSYPFLLEIFDDYENKIIDEKDVIEILQTIESFSFRRIICDVPTHGLNKLFMVLGRDIKKHTGFESDYAGVLKYILTHKKANQRFPTDEEFEEKLISRDIYNFQSKNKLHLLERIENYNNTERVDVEGLLENNELSIEHIMPQKLTSKWRKDLGENWENIHEKYLNTLGNITLTGYNRDMSNKPFLEKRDDENGFKKSRLLLNNYLQNLDCWNEETINKRANILKDIAFNIWEYPKTNYLPAEDTPNLFSLSDDYNFTGEKIKSFIFRDQEYAVKSWKDFYQKISSILYDYDPSIFNSFITDDDFKMRKRVMISETKENLVNPLKVSDNLFIETNLSAESVLSIIRMVLNKYEIDEDEISLYLKEKKEYIRVDKDQFLSALDENGLKVFNKIFEFAEQNNLLIKWGAKGFSLNIEADDEYMSLIFGFPPDCVFKQSIYTGFESWGHHQKIAKKVNNPDEIIEFYKNRLKGLDFFIETGKNLKWLIDKPYSEDEIKSVIDIIKDIILKIKESNTN